VPASGHDKELFFRKWGEISGLGVYASLCELMEGIVTIALLQIHANPKNAKKRSKSPEKRTSAYMQI